MERMLLMVRNIKEDKRADVLARKAAWQKDYDTKKAIYDKQESDYNEACYEIEQGTISTIKSFLGNVPENLSIDVTKRFRGYQVSIEYDNAGIFRDTTALHWHFRITLNKEGTVEKETGSWSGLQATTPEQLNDLRESVRILGVLNEMPWEVILTTANANYPKFDDYYTEPNPDRDAPDWTKELALATVEDSIGQNVLIKGRAAKDRGERYYKIIRQTPKRYEIVTIPPYAVDEVLKGNTDKSIADVVNNYSRFTDGISKDKFFDLVYYSNIENGIDTLEY